MTHLYLVFSFFFLLSISSPVVSQNTSVYTILTNFGLPPGLLPDSVTTYLLTESTGDFIVQLSKPCYIHFDYLVYYDKTITGTLKYGSITKLKGIEVRKLLVWLDVDEIRVDLPPSDYVYFSVGWIVKKLGVEQFEEVKGCDEGYGRCKGFIERFKFNAFESSPSESIQKSQQGRSNELPDVG